MHGEEEGGDVREERSARINRNHSLAFTLHRLHVTQAHDVTQLVRRVLVAGGLEQVLEVVVVSGFVLTRLLGRVRG